MNIDSHTLLDELPLSEELIDELELDDPITEDVLQVRKRFKSPAAMS